MINFLFGLFIYLFILFNSCCQYCLFKFSKVSYFLCFFFPIYSLGQYIQEISCHFRMFSRIPLDRLLVSLILYSCLVWHHQEPLFWKPTWAWVLWHFLRNICSILNIKEVSHCVFYASIISSKRTLQELCACLLVSS